MANDVKWIKIATDIFDDEKIAIIESMPDADTLIVVWFKILTLSGKVSIDGVLMIKETLPYTEEMLASIFRRKQSQISLALKTFEMLGMIEIINGVVTISNWSKHQKLDLIEARREYQKEYMKSRRNKQKQLALGEPCKPNSETNCKPNSKPLCKQDVSTLDIDKEEEDKEDKEKELKKKGKTSRFVPPTLEQVKEYCDSRNNGVDYNKWFNFYQAKGWYVGKNKMKDWKAAVRTWENKEKEVTNGQSYGTTF